MSRYPANVVIYAASRIFNVPVERVRARQNEREVVAARAAMCAWLRQYANGGPSFMDIAIRLGMAGHSTAYSAHQRYQGWPDDVRETLEAKLMRLCAEQEHA